MKMEGEVKKESKVSTKRAIIAAVVVTTCWRLGVYLGLGAFIGGALGGLLVFIIFKILDKFEEKK